MLNLSQSEVHNGLRCIYELRVSYYQMTPQIFWTQVTTILLNCIGSVMAVTGNAVLLLALRCSANLCDRPFFFALQWLCVANIGIGLFAQIAFVVRRSMELDSGNVSCTSMILYQNVAAATSGIAFFTAAFLVLERWAAICHPIKHRTRMTKRKIAITLAFTWIFIFVVTILRVFGLDQRILFFVLALIIAFIITVSFVSYCMILKEVGEGNNRINAFPNDADNVAVNVDRRKEYKIARNTLLKLLLLVLHYTPLMISMLMYNAGGKLEVIAYSIGLPVSETIFMLTSSVDPFLFYFKNRQVREAIITFLRGKCRM